MTYPIIGPSSRRVVFHSMPTPGAVLYQLAPFNIMMFHVVFFWSTANLFSNIQIVIPWTSSACSKRPCGQLHCG